MGVILEIRSKHYKKDTAYITVHGIKLAKVEIDSIEIILRKIYCYESVFYQTAINNLKVLL